MWTLLLFGLAFAAVGLVIQYSVTVSLGGVTIQKSINRTGDHANSYEVALSAAKDVTGWTDTDTDTASCTLPSGHGYTDGNFDVYWTESGVAKRRYGVPGTISTNTLTLDGGSGDDFPATSTTGVVVCKQVQITLACDGDAIALAAMILEYIDPNSTKLGHVDFQDAGPAQVTHKDLSANQPQVYDVAGGASNAFSGNPITVAYASHNDSTNDATLKFISLEDSTP